MSHARMKLNYYTNTAIIFKNCYKNNLLPKYKGVK